MVHLFDMLRVPMRCTRCIKKPQTIEKSMILLELRDFHAVIVYEGEALSTIKVKI